MSLLGVVTSKRLKTERSSAYLVSLNVVSWSGLWTSLKKMFQRHGPRTVPWNTMCERSKEVENWPWTRDDGLAGGEVVSKEGKVGVGEAGDAEFVEEEGSVDVVESTFDVRQKNRDFAGTSEFVDPSVDEEGDEVVGAVVFAEGPLCVSEGIVGVEEGEEGDGEETFRDFGQDGSEVDATVIVRVMGGTFFVEGGKPMEFPESGPFGSGEDFACKESDGKGERAGAVFQDHAGEEVWAGGFRGVDGSEKAESPAGAEKSEV